MARSKRCNISNKLTNSDIESFAIEFVQYLIDNNLLPSKDDVIGDIYSRIYNGEYKQRMVMRNSLQDHYYSGYLDCYDDINNSLKNK